MALALRVLVVVAGLGALTPAAAPGQRPHVDMAGHFGTLDDGRRLLGAQAAVAFVPQWSLAGGATSVRGVGPDASLTIFEAGLRWSPAVTGILQPYLLAGVGVERARSPSVTRSDLGWVAGGGLSGGRGIVRPFVEARAFKNGSVAGLFWAGVRLAFAP